MTNTKIEEHKELIQENIYDFKKTRNRNSLK